MHKKLFVSFWFVIALFLGTVAATAQDPQLQTVANEDPWPFEISDLKPDPAVTWGELDNGVKFAILPNHEPRDRVSLRLYIEAGSLFEKDSQRGVAHFLEHMAFNGTENFGPGTLIEYFQRLGMSFGADTNAYTSFDRTVYMIELPNTEASSIDEGLLVLRDYADRMLLKEEQIDFERGVVLSEMRTRDSVGLRTALAEYDFLLPESLISERFPIGQAEVLRTATREDFVDFYETWYRPERTVIVVVGEVEPDEVEELVKENFASFEPAVPERERPDMGEVVHGETRIELHTEMEAPSTRVSVQTVLPYEPKPDTLENRIFELYRSAASQILSRRLQTLARQEDAPFSQGSASAYEMLNFASMASIDLICEPENWEAALKVAEQELRRALEHGFRPAEVDEIRAVFLNSYEESVRRAATRESGGLAEGIVRTLSSNVVFTSPETELELMRPVLEAMTAEDLLKAFRKAWADEGRLVFVTGNLDLPEGEDRILQVFQASRAEAVEPLEPIEETEFAYTDFGPAGEVAEKKYVEDLDLYQLRFANGVRLNVKQTEFQANTVHTYLRFGGGQLTEPAELAGLSLLASSAFTAGGLGEHTVDELRRLLAGRNVGVGFGVGDDAFTLSGSTTPEDLLLQLQLATAYLTDPGYRPESLRLARTGLREMYRSTRHTAEGVLQAEVSRFLANGDHRFGLPPEEQTLARDLDEVADWLREPLRSGYLEVTIVGDVSPEDAIAAVAETLGALPERKAEKPDFEELRQVTFPENAGAVEYTFESEISNGLTVVYWPTTDTWDIREARRLGVLSRIFSDRMRVRIREEMGDAYSPYAVSRESDTYEDYGLFYGLVAVDPERGPDVARVVKEIAADLNEDGVTEDEMERAMKPLFTSLRNVVRENSYWLYSVMASSQEYPQRLDWARHMISDYQEIEPEDLDVLAKKYLDPEAGLPVFVVPVPNGSKAEANGES